MVTQRSKELDESLCVAVGAAASEKRKKKTHFLVFMPSSGASTRAKGSCCAVRIAKEKPALGGALQWEGENRCADDKDSYHRELKDLFYSVSFNR